MQPMCSNPNVEATVVSPAVPRYPESARLRHVGNVTVLVKVTIGPDGKLQHASVYKSSGSSDIDVAAIFAAEGSTYLPRILQCKPVTGDYIAREDFVEPTPDPSCPVRYQEITITHSVKPEYPDGAHALGLGQVMVLVAVNIGPDGTVRSVSIDKSSGNMAVDMAAMNAAKASSYSPKIVNCTPTSGSYLFVAQFVP